MNLSEKRERSARVLEKFGFLEGLLANPDFIHWLEIGPQKTLDELRVKILGINRSVEGWKERLAELVTSYQSIETTMKGSLNDHIQAVQIARETLKEAEMDRD